MTSDVDLWQYFEDREEQIIAKRQALKEELEALREARAAIENSQRANKSAAAKEKLTIKDMVRSVLSRNPEGGTSDQIINWISQMHGTEVARTSLSPQLSRLKSDHEVALDEETGMWRLSERYHVHDRGSRSWAEMHNRERMMRHNVDVFEQKRRDR